MILYDIMYNVYTCTSTIQYYPVIPCELEKTFFFTFKYKMICIQTWTFISEQNLALKMVKKKQIFIQTCHHSTEN